MRTSYIAIAAVALLGALAACSSMAGGADPGARVPLPETGPRADKQSIPVGRPANPPHYVPVAEADWDVTKPLVGRVMPCQDGKIRVFECQGVELLAFLP